MIEFTTYDDEIEYLSALLLVHNHNDDEYVQNKIVNLISDWFDEHAQNIGILDIKLYKAINNMLDDGVITEEENDTIIAYINQYLRSHKHINYATFKEDRKRLTRDEKAVLEQNSELDKDFIDKICVITGNFKKFPIRKEAEREIIRRGGKTAQSVSGKTNLLICGNSGVGSGKIMQVKNRNKDGQNIKVIDEQTFYKMLESNDTIMEKL